MWRIVSILSKTRDQNTHGQNTLGIYGDTMVILFWGGRGDNSTWPIYVSREPLVLKELVND